MAGERQWFSDAFGVSRETLARLDLYADELMRWQKTHALIGSSTEAEIWRRHFGDSAQLIDQLPDEPRELEIADIGSGAGFPGLVLALMLEDRGRKSHVHLVDSSQKKAAFLRVVSAKLGTRTSVHAVRIEALDLTADVVTARALASVDILLNLADRIRRDHTICLFLKGEDVEAELTESAKHWMIHTRVVPSRSDVSGRILRVEAFARAKSGSLS